MPRDQRRRGKIGTELGKQLEAKGATVRVLAREAAKAAPLRSVRVEIFVGDLTKPATLGPAFAGVDIAFVMTAASDGTMVAAEKNAFDAATFR